VRLLATALGVPRSGLSIASGHTARLKRIEVPLGEVEIEARLSR
jgi:uncharacterized protein YggU (UPF0235/DUF167 family)